MEPISEGRDTPQGATAGAWLRNARQQRGLHIAALAVTLKVPQAKLEALEADRWDELPDTTFARALATAMCRVLKVDPAPALALMPRTGQEFDVRPGLNQPYRERGAGPIDGSVLALLRRPVAWGLALLLLAAAAIYWVPAGWVSERGGAASAPAVADEGPAASAPPAEFIAAPSAPVASEPAASASAAASQPAAASAPPPGREAAASAPAGLALRVAASADSWIEVVDGAGQTLLSRVLLAGEQQELRGALPYKVRVGNVGGTRLEWRGGAVDLAPHASNNVARLELN
ncbi:MAG: helix-turn-helix domain-containing protein [Roseateles sp.]|uniref:helix-turn-helix domain-containing protein n=1 Tax=Roseateles sp. TaxID=1971397 RepID=UPI0039EC1843